MVSFTESNVYEVMTYDWEPLRQIREKLKDRLGVSNLRWYHKAQFILTLSSWDVSVPFLCSKLSSLEKQGLAEHRIEPKIVYDEQIREYQYRKKAGGKRVEVTQPRTGLGRLGLEGAV
ncbi:MAG: hypothetical protein ABIH37_03355 [archaeon]